MPGTALFFLVIAVETFDFAGILGMPARISVVATWICQFTQAGFNASEYGAASAVGVLTALVLLALMLAQAMVFRSGFGIKTMGGRARSASVRLGRGAQVAAKILSWLFALLSIALPFATLVWTSLIPVQQPPSRAALARVSLDVFGAQFRAELWNVGGTSVVLAVIVPDPVVCLTSAMAWTASLHRGTERL